MKIYFQSLIIYFQGLIIYSQGLIIVLSLGLQEFYVLREIVFIPRKENFFSLRINPRKTHHVSKNATKVPLTNYSDISGLKI